MKDFDAYTIGLCYASVCSSLSPRETVKRMNAQHPTGIRHRWKLAPDKTFKTGQPNPCPCENNPSTHKHYLLVC